MEVLTCCYLMVFLIIHCLTAAAKFPAQEFYQSMLRDEMPSSRPVRLGVLVEIKGIENTKSLDILTLVDKTARYYW